MPDWICWVALVAFAAILWARWYFGTEQVETVNDCDEPRWLVRRIRDGRPLAYGAKALTIHRYTRKGPWYVCADDCRTANVTHHYADGTDHVG